MRGLKILVIVMGVLIIIAFGTIIVTLVHRMTAPAVAAREVSVTLPPNTHINSVLGVGDRIILNLNSDIDDFRFNRQLMVVDPATGAVSRVITVKPPSP